MKETYISPSTSSSTINSIYNNNNDEYTFLCGYQKIRRYGSTSIEDLNSPTTNGYSTTTTTIYPIKILKHKVEPNDTLQNLVLKYNSSMYEIKRLNRLWSNDSLYCKIYLNIPIYDDDQTTKDKTIIKNNEITTNIDKTTQKKRKKTTTKKQQQQLEQVDDSESFFKRIDQNLKMSQKLVRKLKKN